MANVYGPRQDPHGEAGVISIFCGVRAESGRATVFGSGRQTRDYLYIDDAVAAWLAAAESEVTGALNVSTGVETSVLDVVDALEMPYDVAPDRAGEIERSCLDPAAAAELLEWATRVPLREGLRRTLGTGGSLRRRPGTISPGRRLRCVQVRTWVSRCDAGGGVQSGACAEWCSAHVALAGKRLGSSSRAASP